MCPIGQVQREYHLIERNHAFAEENRLDAWKDVIASVPTPHDVKIADEKYFEFQNPDRTRGIEAKPNAYC